MKRFDARDLRRTILRMAYAGSSVHIGCAFSIVEILAVLYRSHLRLDADDPLWPHRDYLVLSKGHGVMAQYACLRELGWLEDEELRRYFQDGTRLKGLSDAHVPGLEVTSGSLGHGLSVGVGLAMAARRRGSPQRVFAIVGDGEMNEGSMWEALLLAQHARLDNLLVIVYANGFQAMGRTDEVLKLGDLAVNFSAFGLGNWTGVSATTDDVTTSDESQNVLTFCLAFLNGESPELATVVEAWPRLTEAVRSVIRLLADITRGAKTPWNSRRFALAIAACKIVPSAKLPVRLSRRTSSIGMTQSVDLSIHEPDIKLAGTSSVLWYCRA